MKNFFAGIFELWGAVRTDISNDLYTYELYQTVGMVMIIACIAVFGIFYYVLNSPRYVKPRYWVLTMIFLGIGVAVFALIYSMNKLNYQNLDYLFGDYMPFTIMVLVWTMLLFFIVSLLGKHWSTNLKDSPFRTRR